MSFFWNAMTLVTLLLPGRIWAANQCEDTRANDFNLSVTSRRNFTGHRIVQVVTAMGGSSLSYTPPVILDVDHRQLNDHGSCSTMMTVTTTISPSPPSDYEVVNGLGFYKMHTTALRWEDARDKCVQEGAHLIIINSDEEAEVVRTYFVRKPKILNLTENGHAKLYAHVGFHDRYVEGTYITLKGQPLDQSGYARWDANKPNSRNDHNCGFANKDVKYHDGPCEWQQFYICEFEP
ncbi:hemolymph lipopolysaccharide-binding protein [Anabrus simplex]|uniref:hemolymph lipopolysaccharide-binding protein n=1 Tax=Anabrus simplex TaxID=316456 RepID=UPI0035A3A11B